MRIAAQGKLSEKQDLGRPECLSRKEAPGKLLPDFEDVIERGEKEVSLS